MIRFLRKKPANKTQMKWIVRITRMLFDIAVELRDVQSDPAILWKVVNSLGGDTPFYEILGGGIY